MNADLAALRALLARAKAATGPNRELGVEIWRATCWQDHSSEISPDSPITESIDAAVALIEKVLNWSWRVGNTPSGRGFCFLGTAQHEHEAATVPLAMIVALLSALIAKEEANG